MALSLFPSFAVCKCEDNKVDLKDWKSIKPMRYVEKNPNVNLISPFLQSKSAILVSSVPECSFSKDLPDEKTNSRHDSDKT